MLNKEINIMVATYSGVFGGVGKALSANFTIAAITFQSTCEVAFYAAISTLVGYGVKAGYDMAKKHLTRRGK